MRELHEVSERRAGDAVVLDKSTAQYSSSRAVDGAVRLRIRKLVGHRRRFGYRRLHFLLTSEGYAMNLKRFSRLYREYAKASRRLVFPTTTHQLAGAGLEQVVGVDWHYIAPGKPQQNAFVESSQI